MTRVKTTEQFKSEVASLVGDEYSVLGKYKTNRIKTEMRHNTCGHKYEVTPNNFLRGSRCPKCAVRRRPKTTGQFKSEAQALVGS